MQYGIYNPKNGLIMLADSIGESTISIYWLEGIISDPFDENDLEKFLKGNYKFIDKSDKSDPRECIPKEIAEWIIVLWYNGQLDFTDTFTVKEFLVGV